MRLGVIILCASSFIWFAGLAIATPPLVFPPFQPPPVQGNKQGGNRILRVEANVPIILSYSGQAGDRPRLFIPKRVADAQALNSGVGPERSLASERTWGCGIALSAAFVTGGIWLSRRRSSSARAKVLVCLLITTTVLVTIGQTDLLGDVPPFPPGGRTPRPLPMPAPAPRPAVPVVVQGDRIQIGVDVVIVAEGEHVELVLPRSFMPANGLKNPGQSGK